MCRWNFFSKDKTVMSSSHWHSLPVQALAFTPEGTVCWQITTYVTLPFEMSWMDTWPLSHCGLFSKGASNIWVFSKIRLSSLFCIRNYTPYAKKKKKFVNVIKRVLNIHLLVSKDCMRKALFLDFSE